MKKTADVPLRYSRNASGASETAKRLCLEQAVHNRAPGRLNLPLLRVAANRRFLEDEDGKPFFWLGDTAWELFHRLDAPAAEHYLKTRAAQRFTVIQAVLLAELEGITTGNAYGRLPLHRNAEGEWDPGMPDLEGPYSYWEHVDRLIDLAADNGLYLALLPTWGDKFNRLWGKGPEIFTPANAFAYGNWLGARYRDKSNIVWILGGDRPLHTRNHFEIVGRMAEGLKAGGAPQLMSFHPKGAESSSHHLHHEGWLDFNMIQSGHGETEIRNYERVRHDYELSPHKPTLDAEPCYEDIPIGFQEANGYFDEADVRRAAYYAMLSGAFGHTYGHHSVWPMCEGHYASTDFNEAGVFFIMSWREALERPGAGQMQHLRGLLEPYLGPDFRPEPRIIAHNREGSNYMAAARTCDTAFIYCPNGLYVDVALGYIDGTEVTATWFSPRDGSTLPAGRYPNSGTRRFIAPTSGRGNDWVLIMEGV